MRTVSNERSRPVVVKRMPERMTLPQARAFLREVQPFLNADRPQLVLDLSTVRQTDSAAVEMLLRCMDRAILVFLPAVVRSNCRRALEQMRSPGHSRLLSGSMIMLAGTTLVSALNFAYNLVTAHLLGPADFGHASVAVTLLMLASAITLSFQLVCAKFVAREATPAGQLRMALTFRRRAWLLSLGISALLAGSTGLLTAYLRLPSRVVV